MSFQTIIIEKKKVNDWSDPEFKSAYQKAYREANKDKIKEKLLEKKELITTTPVTTPTSIPSTPKIKLTENLNEYNKSYYQKNREKLLKKANENKERRNEYYTCACGCEVRLNNSTHKKTDKHFKRMQLRELELMGQEDNKGQEDTINVNIRELTK
jgi:putative cell wall-binding protein